MAFINFKEVLIAFHVIPNKKFYFTIPIKFDRGSIKVKKNITQFYRSIIADIFKMLIITFDISKY